MIGATQRKKLVVGALWAISVEAWLRGVEISPTLLPRAQRALDALSKVRHRVPTISNPGAVGPWVDYVQAEANSQGVLVAWAAISTWTELGEELSEGPWRRLAAGLEPLAKALETLAGVEVAKEADELRSKAEKAAEYIR